MSTSPFVAAKGFTLLELLVVIAIVAALAGLLLPAITTAKQSAQALRCASSLRQIGMAAFTYTADHNDQVVAAHGNNGDPWTVRLADYLDAWKGAPTAWPSDAINRASVLWGCPSPRVKKDASVVSRKNGYGMNLFLYCDTSNGWQPAEDTRHNAYIGRSGGGYGWGPWEVLLESRIINPSTRIYFGDAFQVFGATDAGWHMISPMFAERRHRGKANLVFVDGHIGALDLLAINKAIYNP